MAHDSMTMTEAIAELQDRLISSQSSTYTPAMITTALNRAHRHLVSQIRAKIPERYRKVGTALNITSGTDAVDLPIDCVSLQRLEYKSDTNVWYVMDEVHSDKMGLYKETTPQLNLINAIPPFVYCVRWRDDVTAGGDTRQYIELAPVPTSAGTGVLRPLYHYVMDDLVAANHFQLPDVNWEHLCILEALNILYIRDASVFQNYNFQQELKYQRHTCFSTLSRESSRPRRIRRVVGSSWQ